MYMASLHALSFRLPFSYDWRLPAHLIYTGIVASPCTSPRQRTAAPPHSKHSLRLWALSHQAFLPAGGHAISACSCDDHAHATASAVDLLPSTCACGVWSYNTWVVFHPRVNGAKPCAISAFIVIRRLPPIRRAPRTMHERPPSRRHPS